MLTIPETDLVVHPLCLGGNVFGWTAGPEGSHDVLNAYASHGIRAIKKSPTTAKKVPVKAANRDTDATTA